MAQLGTTMRFFAVVAWPLLPGLRAACKEGHADPYMEEASPFGWPMAPNFDWSEHDQECWAEKYPMCAGMSQSPMNDLEVMSSECETEMVGGASDSPLKERAKYLGDGELSSRDWADHGFALEAKVSKYMRTVMVEGPFGELHLEDRAGMKVVYEATQVHITAGALHTINGAHDAEMLVVHRPKGAKDMLAGSVIVSMVFKTGSDTDSNPIFEKIGASAEKGSEWAVQPFGLADVLELNGPVYQYNGSVPVPPCSESVTWLVLQNVQTISAEQLAHLTQTLNKHAGGHEKRTAVARHPASGACRRVVKNGIVVGPSHAAGSCGALAEMHKAAHVAECWASAEHCSAPAAIAAEKAVTNDMSKADITEFVHYTPTEHVTMAPSTYTLDATVAHGGSFGHLMLNGRLFEARKVSIKPIASHTIDGKRYAGELIIEHVLYGDGHSMAMDGHMDSHMDGHSDSHTRRLESQESAAGSHTVMVSVPLMLGKESPFLRHLGLGQPALREAIRDGNAYSVHEVIDLSESLKPALEGSWYWYKGAPLFSGCSEWGTRWMVFETPLEVDFQQLSFLSLPVSGVDSTRLADDTVGVYKERLPKHAVEAVAEDQGGCSGPWSYGNVQCWAANSSMCGAGSKQSPINIRAADVSEVGSDIFLNKLTWKPIQGLQVANTGHGLQVESDQLGYFPFINALGDVDYYQVTEVNLHMPSEHMIDNKLFDAELQVVHKRQESVSEHDDDDIAITSFLFKVGKEDSPLLKQLHLPGREVHEGSPLKVQLPVDLMRAFGPALEAGFYRYDGSLTVPNCAEHVKWFVFETPMEMSQAQWAAFKTYFPNTGNNRPVQPLSGRKLAKNSFMEGTLEEHEFYLSRKTGRSREDIQPGDRMILIPIIFGIVFTIYVWIAVFVREDPQRRQESAGGLKTGLEQTIGRAQPPYTRM